MLIHAYLKWSHFIFMSFNFKVFFAIPHPWKSCASQLMLKNDLTIENFHNPNMGQERISNSNLVCPTLATITMGLWISFVYATIQHVITWLGGDNWKTWKLARIFPWTQVIFTIFISQLIISMKVNLTIKNIGKKKGSGLTNGRKRFNVNHVKF